MDEIIRNDDGSLVVTVAPTRREVAEATDVDADAQVPDHTLTLHPGEGGYAEALARWDLQQDPDRAQAVSTASGREEAMAVVHAVAEDPTHVGDAVEALHDAEASAEALRHVLVGGTPSVQAFADEVVEAEGGEPIAPHTATKIIGEVLAEIDTPN